MKGLITFIRFLFAAAAVFGGLGAAIGGVGALCGAFSLQLDILSHFAPFFAALGLAAVLAAILGGTRVGLFLGLAGLLSAGLLMAPELIAAWRAPSAPLAEPSLKIVEFNLWGRNRDQNATADWILAQDADILVLEEAFGGTERIMTRLRERYPFETPCLHNPCSSVIMSRMRPLATGGISPPPEAPLRPSDLSQEQAADFDPRLRRPRTAGAWATFQDGGGQFTVVGAHLTWPIPAGPQQAQMAQIADTVATFPRERVILAGDFNSTPWSFTLRTLDRRLGLPRHTRALATWPAARFTRMNVPTPFPVLPIDHIYAGPGWDVRIVRGPKLGSDHYPLIITLRDRTAEAD